MQNKSKTKCDFCKYWSGRSCRVTPNSYYCKEAAEEYNAWRFGNKPPAIKSLRKWDKK